MLSGYLSLPMKDTIFAALAEISSQPIFSRRIVSASFECAVDGNIGAPVGPNPRIWVKGHRYRPSYGSHPLTNLHAYTGRTPALYLMLVSEKADTGSPSPIIQRTWDWSIYAPWWGSDYSPTSCEHAQGSRLAAIHVTDDSAAYLGCDRHVLRW